MKKAIVMVSISGGRTSGYMAVWLKNNQELLCKHLKVDAVEFLYLFANTGLEHPETLRFLNDIDTQFLDNQIVWLEGAAHHGKKASTGYNVVNYKTCHQYHDFKKRTHPFHDHVIKYGIPNRVYKNCTRELKRNTINNYMKAHGLDEKKDFYTAIGIRDDEKRRVAKSAGVRNIIYPLIDLIPTDKEDVLDWWEEQPFDLGIPEWLGNCLTCYKKSDRKLALSFRDMPDGWDAFKYFEERYDLVGPEFIRYDDAVARVNFRLNRSVDQMIAMFKLVDDGTEASLANVDGGCSESCEMYDMVET